MSNRKPKVLFIAGAERSGTTVLGNILGSLEHFFHVGELHNLWGEGLIKNHRCGCGVPFRECAIWAAILQEAFGSLDRIEAGQMDLLRGKHRLRVLLLSNRGRKWMARLLAEPINALAKLYQAIAAVTQSRVIVDSSKFYFHGSLLQLIPAIELYVVQLVRDPRGVAYSRLRKKRELAAGGCRPQYMAQLNPVGSSLKWAEHNIGSESLRRPSPERHLLVRYEDFAEAPAATIQRVLEGLGESTARLPFLAPSEAAVRPSHTVSGNPNRFRTGTVQVREDAQWKKKMRPAHRLVVTALTWPLLRRYGYLGTGTSATRMPCAT